MKFNNSLSIMTAAAATVIISSVASADIVNLAYQGKERGLSVKLTSSLYNGDVFAGQLVHTVTGGSIYDGTWVTFCADLAQGVATSPKPFDVVSADLLPGSSPMGIAKASAIRDIYAAAGGSQLLSGADNALAAAFQLAIWEIILDFDVQANGNGLDITAGGLKATKTNGDALSNAVMGHLTTLFGAIGNVDASGIGLVGFKSGQHQDQLIVIPAPGALALLAGFGVVGRRRRSA